MKKYILIILALNIGDLYAHNLSLKDELLMQHTHEKLIVKDVIANDSLKIWKKLMETEYLRWMSPTCNKIYKYILWFILLTKDEFFVLNALHL